METSLGGGMAQPSPYKTQLDAGNAYWMARLAGEVYKRASAKDPSPDGTAILGSLKAEDDGFAEVFGVSNRSSQAALVEHEDYLCLAFRGTDEIADWLDNINAFATPQLFGEFHRGFWQAVEDIWQPLWGAYLEASAAKPRPLFLTGHSLGGAMATIAAARLIHLDLPFTSVYTFGQPRAMTRETARIFNQECQGRFFRFHNNNDLVTRVPARLMGYSHVGTYLYITEAGAIHQEPGFWFRFIDSVRGALDDARELGLDGIKDHDIAEYQAAIAAWRQP